MPPSEDSEKTILEKVEEFVREILRDGVAGHDFEHVERVRELCRKISEREGGDIFVLELAALLHDVGIKEELEHGTPHEEASVRIARQVLMELGVPNEKIEQVVHAIRAHRYRRKEEPKTLEAKILSDADKLDALGAIGVARTFMYGGYLGRTLSDSIRHFYEKLLKLKDIMYTQTAKMIAEKRHNFLLKYLEELKKEISCNDI